MNLRATSDLKGVKVMNEFLNAQPLERNMKKAYESPKLVQLNRDETGSGKNHAVVTETGSYGAS